MLHWGLMIIGGMIFLASFLAIFSGEEKDEDTQGFGCLGVVLAVIIFWGGTAIPVKSHTPPPPPPPEITVGNWNIQLVGTERPGQKLVWGTGKTEQASGTWLIVETIIKNAGKEDASIHPSSFRLKNVRGSYYEHYHDLPIAEVYELYQGGQLIVDRVIAPGTSVHHHFIFDVPISEVNIFNLEIKPNVFEEGKYIEIGSSSTKKHLDSGDKTPPPLAWNTWDLAIVEVEQIGRNLKWLGSEKAIQAEGQWLVVDITATNKSGSNSVIHPFDFRLRDKQGNVYTHYSDLTLTEVYERYRNKDLMVNQVVGIDNVRHHCLLFDVPMESSGFKLEFSPDIFAEAKFYKIDSLHPIIPDKA